MRRLFDTNRVQFAEICWRCNRLCGPLCGLREGDLALCYYSGQGIRVARVSSQLPTDLQARFEDEIPDQAYSAHRIAFTEEIGIDGGSRLLAAARSH
jgi:hypothetical protein